MPRKQKTEEAKISLTTRVEVDIKFGNQALEKILQFLNEYHTGKKTLPFDEYPNEASVPVDLVRAQRKVHGTHRIYIQVSIDMNGNLSYEIV